MIPIDLQDEIEKRMRKLFDDFRLKNPEKDSVSLNIYKQNLPQKESNDLSLFPYLNIKLVDGEQMDESDPQQVRVLFIAGVFDDENTYQGYRDVANIIQKIFSDLKRNPSLLGMYELKHPIKWSIHEEDVYPYYFGGLETLWDIPTPMREDVEAMI